MFLIHHCCRGVASPMQPFEISSAYSHDAKDDNGDPSYTRPVR